MIYDKKMEFDMKLNEDSDSEDLWQENGVWHEIEWRQLTGPGTVFGVIKMIKIMDLKFLLFFFAYFCSNNWVDFFFFFNLYYCNYNHSDFISLYNVNQ